MTLRNLVYTKNGTWDYTLLEDYVIKVDNIDFGDFVVYGTGKYAYTVFVEGKHDTLTIHKGYAWDGCTGVPSYKWNLEASLVHDALYQSKKGFGGEACKASWWQVDRLFLSMMKQAGANWLQRNTYYAGVRTFGSLFKLERFYDVLVMDRSK